MSLFKAVERVEQSNLFQTPTRFVRIHCDSACSVKFGQNPTATATTARLAANV